MTFEEVLPALRAGHKITCNELKKKSIYACIGKYIGDDCIMIKNMSNDSLISDITLFFNSNLFLADDWEFVK